MQFNFVSFLLVCGLGVAVGAILQSFARQEATNPKITVEQQFLQDVTYVMDMRTDICFAMYKPGMITNGGPGFATVPCEKVKSLIAN